MHFKNIGFRCNTLSILSVKRCRIPLFHDNRNFYNDAPYLYLLTVKLP